MSKKQHKPPKGGYKMHFIGWCIDTGRHYGSTHLSTDNALLVTCKMCLKRLNKPGKGRRKKSSFAGSFMLIPSGLYLDPDHVTPGDILGGIEEMQKRFNIK